MPKLCLRRWLASLLWSPSDPMHSTYDYDSPEINGRAIFLPVYHVHGTRGKQRSYQRWLDKRIYKTEMKFWAVLGSRGFREKTTTPNWHKYANFLGGSLMFSMVFF